MKIEFINKPLRHFMVIVLFFSISKNTYSQGDWNLWDDNYNEVKISDLINNRKLHADSVDQGFFEGFYYIQIDKLRFSAQYKGEKRELPDSLRLSMKRANGNREYLPIIEEIKYEYNFSIDNDIYWISMQSIHDESFTKEVEKDENVFLYCLFIGEHDNQGILYNSFIILNYRK